MTSFYVVNLLTWLGHKFPKGCIHGWNSIIKTTVLTETDQQRIDNHFINTQEAVGNQKAEDADEEDRNGKIVKRFNALKPDCGYGTSGSHNSNFAEE